MKQQHTLLKLELRLIGIGVALYLIAWFFGVEEYLQSNLYKIIEDVLLSLALIIIQWFIVYKILLHFRKKYNHYSLIAKRILSAVILSGIAGMFTSFIIMDLPGLIGNRIHFSIFLIGKHFGPMFFLSALQTGALEVFYNFFEITKIDREKEELKKAHIQSQLDSLKSQVNPHFLFNSLNTLSSLIKTSPEKAEIFVLELSSIYRYLLQANENELTTLSQELQFARSYLNLLKTRFGEGLYWKELIDVETLYMKLPSLTLQLLLENAVKHNIVSGTKPLNILIKTENKEDQYYLTVQNNLQRKPLSIPSSKKGLINIISKFNLLYGKEIIIIDNNIFFSVSFPLLKINKNEVTCH